MKNKILFDARFYGLEHGGLGRYTMNLVNELQKIDSETEYAILLREKYFNLLKLKNNWKKIRLEVKHYTISEQLKLLKVIGKEKPDLVHFPHFNAPFLYFGNFVVTIHDLLMHKSKGKETTTLPFYKYMLWHLGYNMVFWHSVKFSKKVIVPSNFVKKELVDYYKINEDKIEVMYEGLDKAIISEKQNKEELLKKYKLNKPYYIYVGNTYPHKNIERAIEAIKRLNIEKSNKILLVIVSSRDVFTQRLKKKITQIGAEDSVKLIGFVPDEDLGGLLNNSLAFVYPSLSEGFGLQGLESISAGTLVLASDIPVFKEIYKGSVFYFDPHDSQSIQERMKAVMEMDPSERKKRIINSQRFIKKYSWSKMAKQTLGVYESCLSI